MKHSLYKTKKPLDRSPAVVSLIFSFASNFKLLSRISSRTNSNSNKISSRSSNSNNSRNNNSNKISSRTNSNRAGIAEEGNPNPGGSCRNPRKHDHKSAPGTGEQTGAAFRNTHVSNLHPQGRGCSRMERTGERMETELPCTHDIRLDGRTHRKDNQAQPARHGRDADHNGRVSEHGARCVLRPEAPFSNTVQESG